MNVINPSALAGRFRASGRARKLVLVAEDGPSVRALYAKWLRYAGFDVVEAANGVEAEALVQRGCPDCALLDVVMPGVNGYQLCRNLVRADHPLPVVLMSVKDQDLDRRYALQQGASAYLRKPFTADELIHAVRDAIGAHPH